MGLFEPQNYNQMLTGWTQQLNGEDKGKIFSKVENRPVELTKSK
jgi:hypothetical protein